MLRTVHSQEDVKLVQHQKPATATAGPQDVEITASAIDFFVADGRRLERADTSGPLRLPCGHTPVADSRHVTAKFQRFSMIWDSWLLSMARPTLASCRKLRVSRIGSAPVPCLTPPFIRAAVSIRSCSKAASLTCDGDRKAWATAPLTRQPTRSGLNGSPRVVDGGMTTTGRTMRLNRATGDAYAEGDVKSTYSDLKAQPNGALLAASDPIHVTARTMTAHSSPAVALYTGDARLWQDANVMEAPSIEFDREHRSVWPEDHPPNRCPL